MPIENFPQIEVKSLYFATNDDDSQNILINPYIFYRLSSIIPKVIIESRAGKKSFKKDDK